jgi:hypothetical protein
MVRNGCEAKRGNYTLEVRVSRPNQGNLVLVLEMNLAPQGPVFVDWYLSCGFASSTGFWFVV